MSILIPDRLEKLAGGLRVALTVNRELEEHGKWLMDTSKGLEKAHKALKSLPGALEDLGMNIRRLSETDDAIHGEGETETLKDDILMAIHSYWRSHANEVERVTQLLSSIESHLLEAKKIL